MQCWGCCCSRVLYSSNVWSKSSRPRLSRCLLVPRLAAATRVALGARSCHHHAAAASAPRRSPRCAAVGVAAAYVFSWDPLRLTGLTAEAAEAVALSGTTVAWLRLRDLAQPNIHTVVHTKLWHLRSKIMVYIFNKVELSWLFAYQQKRTVFGMWQNNSILVHPMKCMWI